MRLQLATPPRIDLPDLTGAPDTVRLFVHTGLAYSIDKATSVPQKDTTGNVTGTIKVPDSMIRVGFGIRANWLPSSM